MLISPTLVFASLDSDSQMPCLVLLDCLQGGGNDMRGACGGRVRGCDGGVRGGGGGVMGGGGGGGMRN